MDLGVGNGIGQVLTYKGRGEAGPSSKIAGVNGIFPVADKGAKSGVVQKFSRYTRILHT